MLQQVHQPNRIRLAPGVGDRGHWQVLAQGVIECKPTFVDQVHHAKCGEHFSDRSNAKLGAPMYRFPRVSIRDAQVNLGQGVVFVDDDGSHRR